MAPDISEESAPREGGVKSSGPIEGKASGPNRDYEDRGDVQSSGGQMERERWERQGYGGRFMREGERGASLERAPRERRREGSYGPPRGFYGGPQPDRRDMPIEYVRERMYGYGRMGSGDYGSPTGPSYGMDFGRLPPEGRQDFGRYNRGYDEPSRPPYRPEHLGYGDRYGGDYDRSRRGDYHGMGTSSRRAHSCFPSGYRYCPPVPLQAVPQYRYGYPGY